MRETIIKYIGVQVVCYVIDFGGFYYFYAVLGANAILANVFGKLLAGAFGFLAHKHYTFERGASGRLLREAIAYFATLAFNIPLSSAILNQLLSLAPPMMGKIISDTICIALTFIVTRTLVFRHRT